MLPTQRTETVLIVDDDEFIIEIAGAMLTRHGYRVLSATSGPRALRLLESQPHIAIDMALLDIVMPVMDGVELAIRLGEMLPRLPIIFMSSYAENPELRPENVRNVQFLAKPFTSVKLANKIREVLDSPPSMFAAVFSSPRRMQ